MSGYLGSIGFAFPAALGACAATNRKRHAITVGGDGGFAQYMAELVASVKYNMNIKLILLDNSELGKITKEQPSGGFEKFAFNLIHLDFAGYTNNYRAVGIKVTSKNEHETKMTQILNHPETTLLEIINDVNLV